MFKKCLSIVLSVVLCLSLASCNRQASFEPQDENLSADSNTSHIQETTAREEYDGLNNYENIVLNQMLKFMGYYIKYPSDAKISNSEYGKTFQYNSEIAVFVEAPVTAGYFTETNELKDTPKLCEEYLTKTLEDTLPDLFNDDKTTQEIKSVKDETINGIEMLRVDGVFVNSVKNTEINFVGYYLLSGMDPVYIVCVPLKSNVNIDNFIDNIANNMTK